MSNQALAEPDFETLFEQAPSLDMVLDPNLRVVAASDAHLQAIRTRVERWAVFRPQPDAFDLVIPDQVMPYLPGNRFSQELLAVCPDIPIILSTGFSEMVDEDKATPQGARGVIAGIHIQNQEA